MYEQAQTRRIRRGTKGQVYFHYKKWRFHIDRGESRISWGKSFATKQEALDEQARFIYEHEMHWRLGMTSAMLRKKE